MYLDMRVSVLAIVLTLLLVAGLAVFFLVYMTGGPEAGKAPKVYSMIIVSPVFEEGGAIPVRYSCDGLNISPPLKWSGYPSSAKSFAIIVEDPDAPGGLFTHWVIYNIPAQVGSLPEGVPREVRLEMGALQGLNDFGRIGYDGPCPPPGERHRYVFKIFALDGFLDVGSGLSREELLEAMEGHVVAEGELTGIYKRVG